MELGTHFIIACIQFKREAMVSQNPCPNWKRTYMNIWITLVQNSMRTVLQYALEYFGDVCRRFSLSLLDNVNTPFLLFTFLENKPLNDHKAYLFWKRAQSCVLRNAYIYNDLCINHCPLNKDLSCLPACTGNSNVTTVHTKTHRRRFHIYPLWRAFSNLCVYGERFHRLRVAGRPKRIKSSRLLAFAFTIVFVWTEPNVVD